MSRPLNLAVEHVRDIAANAFVMDVQFRQGTGNSSRAELHPETLEMVLARLDALELVATAALAREAAETALARHKQGHVTAARDGATWEAWHREHDLLTADRTAAVEALRAALATISGEEAK